MRSILQGAYRTACIWGAREEFAEPESSEMDWDTDALAYFVREPFPSVGLGTDLTTGRIPNGTSLAVTSEMAQAGVIFSDGITQDAIEFHSGCAPRSAFQRIMALSSSNE